MRTAVVYALVLIGVRLSGKREVGQMTPFDLVLLLLLSNSVQNAMTGPDTSLAGGMVAATVLLGLNYVIADLSGVNRRFRKFIQGEPSMLIHDGEVIEARARGEVILSAGAIGSIQVLHRSGIGPGEWLSPLGIDVVLDRPGVGRNLQDHLQQRAIYKVSGVKTLN